MKRSSTDPVFFIHTSGTAILAWETAERQGFGTELSKVYNDWDGVDEVTSMPDSALHRHVDKAVLKLSSANPQVVKTAIVCPPTIYGPGRGPDNQRSVQAYIAAKATLQRKQGFLPLKGDNVWHGVHVHDLSNLYLLLGEAAAIGGGKATWNENGYYFAENGSFTWKSILERIAQIAKEKGLIGSDETPSLTADELAVLHPYGLYLLASNSRGRAVRAGNVLGWKAEGRSLQDELPTIVEGEARALGFIEGHAAKVAQ
jgi:nucleoside-diphosphate-sugar epimerase